MQKNTYSQEQAFSIPAGFADYYENHIKPQAALFEQKRKIYLRTFYLRLLLGVVLILCSFYIDPNYLKVTADAMQHIQGILMACTFLIVLQPKLSYEKEIKAKVFPIVFKFFGDDLIYNPTPKFTANSLRQFGIIPRFDGESSQDYIKAKYKDVVIHMVQSYLITGYGRYRRTQFYGVFIDLSMNKKFNCKTILRRELGLIADLFQMSPELEPVQLEDVNFANIFKVYSDDQVQARYLLTTSFMQNLLELSELFGSKAIEASFYDQSLLLKIDSNQLWFQPDSMFERCNFAGDSRMILQKMGLLFKIIDTLKLDQHTGL